MEKLDLRKVYDCFGGFVSVKHIPCGDTHTTPNIIEADDGAYVCEKCGEEVSKETSRSLFKKRVPRP